MTDEMDEGHIDPGVDSKEVQPKSADPLANAVAKPDPEVKPKADVAIDKDAKAEVDPSWPADWREKVARGDEKKLARLSSYASPEAVAVWVIPGVSSAVVGTAARERTHTATGAIPGVASTIVGASTRYRQFDSSGIVVGAGAVIAGTSVLNKTHDGVGVLAGVSSTITGDAARGGTVDHTTTGALAGAGATVAGTAVHHLLHTTSGIIVGPGSTVAGASVHNRQHVLSGILAGVSSTIVGTARIPALHGSAGVLVGACATLSNQQAAYLESLARLHGLVDDLVISETARSDGTVIQTVAEAGTTVTVTTTAAPSGAAGDSGLTAQQAAWLSELAQIYGLIDPLDVTNTLRSSGTLSQTITTAGGTTTVSRV